MKSLIYKTGLALFLCCAFGLHPLCGETGENAVQKEENIAPQEKTPAKCEVDHSQKDLYLSLQKYVVSIEIRATNAAYTSTGTSFGTGSVLHKEQGIILTNAHVAKPDAVVDHYDITLHDGTVCEAKLIYVDPWHDFALLQTDPKHLSSIPESIPTKTNSVALGDPVTLIGKNENKHFSMQTGSIANPYDTTEMLPSQCFRISLNAQGGASGSPVINQDGLVIGLIFASNGSTSAFALPIDYALDALQCVLKGEKPKRFATGALFAMRSLDDLVRYDNLDHAFVEEYAKKFEGAFNRGLVVTNVLMDSPATQLLQPGDLIVKVNDEDIGPSLYKLNKLVNEHKTHEKYKKKVKFDIIRHGKAQTVHVPTYDLFTYKISRLVHFGQAVFYENDDSIVQITGAPRGVFISNISPGGSFYDVIPSLSTGQSSSRSLVALTHLDGEPITKLDDLIKVLPRVIKKKHFYVTIRNFATEMIYNREYSFTQQPQIKYASYYDVDGLPDLFTFDEKTHSWVKESIK